MRRYFSNELFDLPQNYHKRKDHGPRDRKLSKVSVNSRALLWQLKSLVPRYSQISWQLATSPPDTVRVSKTVVAFHTGADDEELRH